MAAVQNQQEIAVWWHRQKLHAVKWKHVGSTPDIVAYFSNLHYIFKNCNINVNIKKLREGNKNCGDQKFQIVSQHTGGFCNNFDQLKKCKNP